MTTAPNNRRRVPPISSPEVFDCVIFRPSEPTTPRELGAPSGVTETALILIRPGTWLSAWAPTFAETEMPEPTAPGIWAWIDAGTQPGYDNDTGRVDSIVWRGTWQRLDPDQVQALAVGKPPWHE